MNKKLPIEEALESRLNNLPVPNEDAAWQEMSRLLDKEKKPKIIYFKRLGLLLLLLALLLAGYWQWFQQDKLVDQTLTAAPGNGQRTHVSSEKQQEPAKQINSSESSLPAEKSLSTSKDSGDIRQGQPAGDYSGKPVLNEQSLDHKSKSLNSAKSTLNNDKPVRSVVVHQKKRSTTKPLSGRDKALSMIPIHDENGKQLNRALPTGKDDLVDSKSTKIRNTKQGTNGKARVAIIAQEPLSDDNNVSKTLTSTQESKATSVLPELINEQVVPQPDSAAAVKPIAIVKNDSLLTQKINAKAIDSATKHQRKQSKFVWSAGIGMQQQLPLGGKVFNSYGFNGKSNLLHDYIPSLYLAFEKQQRWFVLAEIQFGAPRMVDAFTYSRSTSLNYFEGELSTATLQLKKTFYHKASIGFHHYISKHFSAGVGMDYHLLYRAITESRLTIKQLPDQAETSSSQLLPAGYQDSFLYRSLVGMQVQVNYQWRKFSFGLRYSADLQPFIKYTEPSGKIATRKDKRLEILARYRIWRSGK